MNSPLALVLALGLLVAVGLLYLQRVGPGPAGRIWTLGWAALWCEGAIAAWRGADPLLGAFGNLLGGVFAGAMLAGARVWRDPAASGRLALAAGLGLGATSAALRAVEVALAAHLVARLESLLLLAAAWTLRPSGGRRLAHPEVVIAAGLVALAGVHLFDAPLRRVGASQLEIFALWGSIGLAVGFAQLLAFLDRSREGERRLLELARRRADLLDSERDALRALVESVPAAIALVDSDGRVRLHNREALTLLGFDRDATLAGLDIEEVAERAASRVSGSLRGEFLARVRELGWHPEAGGEIEVALDQPRRWLALSAHAVRSPEGDDFGRLWVARDQTEARRLSERLARAERMETLGIFVGGVAHDFNNQLTTILGNAWLLSAELSRDDPRRELALDLQRAAEHSAALTKDLLEFARRRESRPEAVDLAEEFLRLEALLRPKLPERIRLEIRTAQGLPRLLADPTQLRRVVMNLATNAAESIAGEGCVRVEAEPAPAPAGPTPRVRLCVSDDGCGMAAATRAHLFDPFYTTKPPGEGTGLGLAIVYGIVKAHAAEIEVESAPGRGTCITLLWPTARAGIAAGAPAGADAELPGQGRVVLLAEDEPGVRTLARRALQRRGYQVIETADGEQAVEALRREPGTVDIAVLDVKMPGLDGVQTLGALRRLRPGLPAVLVSGWVDSGQRTRLPDDVPLLAKPFEPDRLTLLVGDELARASGSRGVPSSQSSVARSSAASAEPGLGPVA